MIKKSCGGIQWLYSIQISINVSDKTQKDINFEGILSFITIRSHNLTYCPLFKSDHYLFWFDKFSVACNIPRDKLKFEIPTYLQNNIISQVKSCLYCLSL